MKLTRFLKGGFNFVIVLAMVACGQSTSEIRSPEATNSAISTGITSVTQRTPPRQPSPSLSPPEVIVITPSRTSVFPRGANPLTGLAVTSSENLERRPILIKVANSPRDVRPQGGLLMADLVFEYSVDDSTTCFAAVFHGLDAERVGPIHSAHFIDLEFARMYDASLVFGSATHQVWERINSSEMAERVVSEYLTGCPPMCRTDPTDLHSLFTNTEDLEEHFENLDTAMESAPLGGMTFEMQAPAGGEAAELIDIRYSSETFSQWTYDVGIGMYLRSEETGADQVEVEPLIDAFAGQRVGAANVIVVFVPHERYHADAEMFEIRLIGRGPAFVFRDQRAYRITWERIDLYRQLTFETDYGQSFPLKPGNTWIELVGSTSLIEQPVDDTWSVRFRVP